MSTVNKSENNINRIENDTCGIEIENYKKSHSNNIYLKTYSNFYNNPKIKIIKNKTPSSNIYRMKYPSLKISKENKNSIYNPSYGLMENEQNCKDSLLLEVKNTQKKIKEINKELKELQEDYNILEKQNFSNFYIIENILEKEDTNDEKMKKKRDKNKNIFKNEEKNKIYVLKKQINLYDLTIRKNCNKLDEIQNKSKSKKYKEIMNLLYNKENEIYELSQRINKYNHILLEVDSKLYFYNLMN